jgi:hypothetical protein
MGERPDRARQHEQPAAQRRRKAELRKTPVAPSTFIRIGPPFIGGEPCLNHRADDREAPTASPQEPGRIINAHAVTKIQFEIDFTDPDWHSIVNGGHTLELTKRRIKDDTITR